MSSEEQTVGEHMIRPRTEERTQVNKQNPAMIQLASPQMALRSDNQQCSKLHSTSTVKKNPLKP